jgi:hypothetical protein
LINSSSEDRDDSHSEILKLASIFDLGNESIDLDQHRRSSDTNDDSDSSNLSVQSRKQIERSVITQSTIIPSIDKNSDIKSELDLLLASIQNVCPQPPNLEQIPDPGSISEILAKIAISESITDIQQLLQDLIISHDRLTTARTELKVLYQDSQAQVDSVNASTLEVKQIKFRTQQLAKHSKNQIDKVQAMLGVLAQIRTEIVTSLDKFGGYEEINLMLTQLETARHTLVITHDALRETLREQTTTGQATYNSLQVIQSQVATRSHESEQKLQQYQESIQNLFQTISTDRLRIAGMSVDMSKKVTDLHSLNAQITTMHAQITGKSQALQSRIAEIDRSFIELSQSVQQEQKQFYELTVETIEKADLIRSQLADITKQMSTDRASIYTIETEIKTLHQNINLDIMQQLNSFDLRHQEMNLIWNNFQARYKQQVILVKKLSGWLWVLSFSVGAIFILLIRVLVSLK